MSGISTDITLLAVALLLGVSGAEAQPAPQRPAPLFDSDVPVQLRFAGDLRTLINDRDSVESTWHPFTLTYRVGDEPPAVLDVKFRTRGHRRGQERNSSTKKLMTYATTTCQP